MNFNLKQSKQSALEMLFSQRSKGKYSCRYLSSWNSKISAWLGQNTSAPYIPKVTLMTISHLAYMLLGESYLFTLLTLFLKLLLWSPLLEYQGLYSQGYLKKGLIPEKEKKKRINIFRTIWTQWRRGIFTTEVFSSSFLSHMPNISCHYIQHSWISAEESVA